MLVLYKSTITKYSAFSVLTNPARALQHPHTNTQSYDTREVPVLEPATKLIRRETGGIGNIISPLSSLEKRETR